MHGVGRLKGIVKIVESDYLERARELHGWQGNRKDVAGTRQNQPHEREGYPSLRGRKSSDDQSRNLASPWNIREPAKKRSHEIRVPPGLQAAGT